MKKKLLGIIIGIAFAVLAAAGVLAAVLHKNAGRQPVVPTGTPAPTATTTPAAEETPAAKPTKVPEQILTPAAEPTKEPAKDPTEAPTKEPTPEATMAPTEAPTPTITPMPTPTPVPTATPTPTPVPTPLVEYKKDGVDVRIVQTFRLSDTTYAYVFENGKTAIADSETGYSGRIGTGYKNPETVDVKTVTERILAYSEAGYLDDSRFTIETQYLPTPTPTPTPFPTPNPEQPKLLASFECGKSGDNVTEEIWDNGYVYVKGTGTLRSVDFIVPKSENKKIGEALSYVDTSWFTLTHAVIEEGITSLNDSFYRSIKSLVYIELPSTLKTIDVELFNAVRNPDSDVTVVGYKDGKQITFRVLPGEGLGDAIISCLDVTRWSPKKP